MRPLHKAIGALLYLFPARFRRAFGRDMLAAFDDGWRERAGWRWAARTAADLVIAAVKERFHPQLARETSAAQGDNLMTILWQDLRFALRSLRRSPAFALVALATLALGIGVNTAMFSIAHSVLWSSLPYPHPERIVSVGEVDGKNPDILWGTSYLNFRDWHARAASFDAFALVMSDDRVLRAGAEPVRISGLAVSHDFFDVMGVAPSLGRVFSAAEDRKDGPPVIVLSHALWRSRFAGDPSILGRSIRLADGVVTVIGVMPEGFEYRQAEFWTPIEQVVNPYFAGHRNVWVMSAVARLRAGKSQAEAETEMEGIAAAIRRDYPETRRGQVVRVTPLRAELTRDLRPALLVLLGAVGFVLLIACGNLAGLMLVRGAGRAREMAIRSALGVGRRGLIRQLLTESAVLALAGGAAGIGLAHWATRSIALLTRDPRLLDVPLDGSVLAFAALATIVTTLLFGVAPAIRATRVDASESLRSGGRAGMAPERALAQRVLVVAEVALCLVLLAGAGLLFRSFRRVLEVNPGFRTESLVSMRAELPQTYQTVAAVDEFYRRALERIGALPGVSGATLADRLPITGGEANGDISIEGRSSVEGELGASTFRRVASDYFSVLGIPLERGRTFDARDDGSRWRVTIVSDSLARHFFPAGDAVGHRIKIGPRDSSPWMEIVGVVGDVRQVGLDADAPYSIYEPLPARAVLHFDVAARAAGDPAAIIASMRRELHALEPALLIDREQTMAQRIDSTVAPRRLNLVLFGLFAGLALLLAALGLYGVAAYAAGQRTQEFGIRMALGAQRGDVLRMVLGEGLRLAMIGVVIGLAAALALARLMTGLLFGVQPADPATLAAVALLLSIVMLAACWLPAYRATRIAPVEALRAE